MRVEALVLEEFRNYERVAVEFAPGLNFVVGPNAQGKTNLLEAVYCLSGLGSPRSSDPALIRRGSERAFVHASVVRHHRSLRLDLELREKRGTRARVNGNPVTSTTALAEMVVSVFFGPDDLLLVKGAPEGRRRFVDDLAVKIRPARSVLRKEWERIIRQRNALLKTAPRSGRRLSDTLEVWNDAMCRTGAALTAARLETLSCLLPHAGSYYERLSGGGRLDLDYASEWVEGDLAGRAVATSWAIDPAVLRDALAGAIEAVQVREIERGVSLVGPQRDDVVVRLSSGSDDSGGLLDTRAFASQGEQRSAAISLKLAEYDLLTGALGEEPILLLDDVFSELDPSRRSWLADALRTSGQAIVSSAEPETVSTVGAERLLEVRAGTVSVRA